MGFASTEYIHTFVEAKKLVYEDRALYYADPDFSKTPINYLISKEYAKKRRQLINPKKAAKKVTAGDLPLENGDTIYLTVADKDGNMVSLIQSNYGDMGAGLTPPKLGFSFQNRGQLFSLKEGHPNVYAPNKRPFHTIIPAFVTKDDKPWLSFGLMGGSMQPQGHAQIIVNLVDFEMNLQEAGDAARIRHTGSSQPTDEIMRDGGKLYLETSIGNDTRNQLKEMGHNLPNDTHVYGGYQAIMYDSSKEIYIGASDPRKDGQASGY
jgi:gamma-glutamyltranspeptidase/glutathione hydrolase